MRLAPASDSDIQGQAGLPVRAQDAGEVLLMTGVGEVTSEASRPAGGIGTYPDQSINWPPFTSMVSPTT